MFKWILMYIDLTCELRSTSYNTYDEAQKKAEELEFLGLPTEVRRADQSDCGYHEFKLPGLGETWDASRRTFRLLMMAELKAEMRQ